jgi:hypothetical protein
MSHSFTFLFFFFCDTSSNSKLKHDLSMKKQLKTKVNGYHRPGQTYSVLGIDSIATQKGSGYETTTSPYIYSVT